ncbi:MAG: hypothetical protein ACIALR_14780, partial [Blastopirellula sp. JB062]
MTPEDYQQACDAFEHASRLPVPSRKAWLAAHFADRPDLEKHVVSMLAQDDDSRLDRSPLEDALKPDSPTIAYLHNAASTHAADNLQIVGYEVEEEIARGGMGVVLRAHDERIGRDVAVKV